MNFFVTFLLEIAFVIGAGLVAAGVPLLLVHLATPYLLPYVARLFVEPPTCGTCGSRMKYQDCGGTWAWDCPHWKRDDHRFETDDGGVIYSTSGTPEGDR